MPSSPRTIRNLPACMAWSRRTRKSRRSSGASRRNSGWSLATARVRPELGFRWCLQRWARKKKSGGPELIHSVGAPFIAPEDRRLHPVRRLAGGGSNAGRSSTELLDCSRKTMTNRYAGRLQMGWLGSWARLTPGPVLDCGQVSPSSLSFSSFILFSILF
jgi:hypothetical protein